MTITRRVYSSVISDVIGNEPILDQLDIEYGDAFYGTLQDDYVTGSMIVTKSEDAYVTGTRGRFFSKIYSDETAPLNAGMFSSESKLFPRFSMRLQPHHEKASNSFRVSQFFDDKERFYDSCLPDLENALKHDGTYPKSIVTKSNWKNNFLQLRNTAASQSLCQTKNFPINDLAFITFNVPKITGALGDPSVNNEWTWSYPYEQKFNPTHRYLQLNDTLGISKIEAETLPAIPTGKESLFPLQPDFPYSMPHDLPLLTYASNIYTGSSTLSLKKKTSGIIPILPGKLPRRILPPGSRNGCRTYYPYDQDSYLTPILESDDENFGFSITVGSDMNLSSWIKNREDLDDTFRPITGSMSKEDLTKFFFGFGDVNNMTYVNHVFNSTTGSQYYTTEFESIKSGYINSINFNKPDYPVMSLEAEGTVGSDITPFPLNPNQDWDVITQNAAAPAGYWSYTNGGSQVTWLQNSLASNDAFLVGATRVPGVPATTIALFHITSSYAWQYSYTRGVISDNSANFISSSVSRWNANSYRDGAGFSSSDTYYWEEVLSAGYHDSGDLIHGGPGKNNQTLDPVLNNFTSIVFAPGAYKLGIFFSRQQAGSTADFAAISDFTLTVYPSSSFASNETTMGGNNYPDFRAKLVNDTAYLLKPNPDKDPTPTNQHPYREYLKERNSIFFSMSPVIRGWKYGLQSGLPSYTKATFRRDRFGQPRDMLEQRPYTKFINHNNNIFAGEATPGSSPYPDPTTGKAPVEGQQGAPPVTVNFVKQSYTKDDRGIGKIFFNTVNPLATTSHNLSTEVTSSLPFFDGEARDRPESSYQTNTGIKLSTITFTGTTTALTIT